MRFAQPPKVLAVLCTSIFLILINFRYFHPETTQQQNKEPSASGQAEIAQTGPEGMALEQIASPTPLTVVVPDPPVPQATDSSSSILPTDQVLEDPTPTLPPTPVIQQPTPTVDLALPTIIDQHQVAQDLETQDLPQTRDVTPELERFIQEVAGGQAGSLDGVYVEGVMALRVVQQPGGDVGFVSMEAGTATQFQSPIKYGVIGLLAHNFLSGSLFFSLNPGQEIVLVFGDSSLRRYRVTVIENFERLTRADLRSNFVDLASASVHTADEVFQRFYNGAHHLTLQTCIEKDGVLNWGVRFIVAEPLES